VGHLGLVHPVVALLLLQPLAGGTPDAAGVAVDEIALLSEQLFEEVVLAQGPEQQGKVESRDRY